MSGSAGLDRCLSFINCQISPPGRKGTATRQPGEQRRLVTISRQAGSGAHLIANRLAEILEQQAPNASCPWTVFDRNLVEKVLEDHNLPTRLARFMREDRVSEISDTMDELFGLHPSSWTLVHKSTETMLHLAEIGNVILIGRGAHIVTRSIHYAFHVRLVGSPERRLAHLQDAYRMKAREAANFMRAEDQGRKRFLRKYFDEDIDNPLGYHLVINTDLVAYEAAAKAIADTMLALNPVPT